ncbi:MAG: TIR domain-containing protein [Hyphomonadaceae bacterium]
MQKIFISYRRQDSQYQADRLYEALKKRVRNAKHNIFIDVDHIPAGVDFTQHLDDQVSKCDVLLALIGPEWLTLKDPANGLPRLYDPKDFVRIEIASALRRDIPVVPLLLDGTPFPSEDSLPEDLRGLARRNGVEIRRLTFDADVDRLIRGLRSRPADKPRPWLRGSDPSPKQAEEGLTPEQMPGPSPDPVVPALQPIATTVEGPNVDVVRVSQNTTPDPVAQVEPSITTRPEAPQRRSGVALIAALGVVAAAVGGATVWLMPKEQSSTPKPPVAAVVGADAPPLELVDRTGQPAGALASSTASFDGDPATQAAMTFWWTESGLGSNLQNAVASAPLKLSVNVPLQTALVSAVKDAFGKDETLAEAFAIAIDNADGSVHAAATLNRSLASADPQQIIAGSELIRTDRTLWKVGDLALPLGFLKAFEGGMTFRTIRNDQPTMIGAWKVQNRTNEYYGPVTLGEALSNHRNTVAAQVLTEVGPEKLALIRCSPDALSRLLHRKVRSTHCSTNVGSTVRRSRRHTPQSRTPGPLP